MADILVIGAGPGGYVCAIRLAQLGKKVLLVDKEEIGGVCLNKGCIPTKALLYATGIIKDSRLAKTFGVSFNEPVISLDALRDWQNKVVERLRRGIGQLLRLNGVEYLKAEARFASENSILLKNGSREESIRPKVIIIAAGSEPIRSLRINSKNVEADAKRIITSDEALQLRPIPKELLIVGAGSIGLEFATIYSRLGSKVTIIEIKEQVLPGIDKEMSNHLKRSLEKNGIEIYLNSEIDSIEDNSQGGMGVKVRNGDKAQDFSCDRILLALGRKPLSQGLGLEQTGIKIDNGRIVVNKLLLAQDNPQIYAIGDVIGPPFLAHKAMAQAGYVAERIAGIETKEWEDRPIPNCVYTDPEFASIGLTEDEAKNAGYEILIGRAPLTAIGKAHSMNKTEGLAKVIVDKRTDKILGVHILAPEAENLITQGTLMMGNKTKEWAKVIYPHPTLSELLFEALLNVHKQAIHIFNG